MNSKFWKLVFILTASVAVFMLGCADEDEDNNNTPQLRIVGTWDATQAALDTLGLDAFTYYFGNNAAYTYYRSANGTPIDERGTFDVIQDSVHFHATLRDDVTINENYARRYDIDEATDTVNDTMQVWIVEDDDTYIAEFFRSNDQ